MHNAVLVSRAWRERTVKIDVAYTAKLANLPLSEKEMEVFQPQMENIVKYVEKISEVDIEGVEPMMHGCDVANALRYDVVKPSMPRETALGNAPAANDGEFLLPKIVEGAES